MALTAREFIQQGGLSDSTSAVQNAEFCPTTQLAKYD
jgi:hypothetical protein